MKTLLVEDDIQKRKRIRDFLREHHPLITLVEANSYHTGLQMLLSEHFDLLLLDMSLPTFDVTATEAGYKFRHFAGREIMDELAVIGKNVPTIVITALDKFGTGPAQRTLEQLKLELASDYPIYRGAVSYSGSEDAWKEALTDAIAAIRK